MSEPDPESGLFNPFPTFGFTGPLRPVYPLSAKREVPNSIPHPDYANDGIPRSERRFVSRHNVKVLDAKEQDGMRKVCRLAREVLDIAAAAVKHAWKETYVTKDAEMQLYMLKLPVISIPSELRPLPEIVLHITQ